MQIYTLCLVQVGNGIELEAVGFPFEPYWWRPCGVTWDSSRTVVVIKLRRTSALCYIIPYVIVQQFVLHITICKMLVNTKFTAHPPPQPGGRADACKTHPSAPTAPAPLQGFLRLLISLAPPPSPPFLSPCFCFSHRYLFWLPPPVIPHPRAVLK